MHDRDGGKFLPLDPDSLPPNGRSSGRGNSAASFSWMSVQTLSDRGRTDKEPAVCTNDQKCILRIRLLGIECGDAVFLPLADFTGMCATGFPGNFEYCHL